MSALRAAVAMAASVAIGALTMHVLERNAPPSISTQLAQPFAVLTSAGRFGSIELTVLIAALAIATLAYMLLLRLTPPGTAWTAALTAVTVTICAWTIPVAFSSDAYAYAVYGERALRGLDPFARIALAGGDPLYVAARVQWGVALPACVYGWGFVGAAAVAVGIASPFGTVAQITALRALASLSMLACAALALAAYSGERAERVRAAVFIGCNPVALWCAAEGHNDALALAIGLLGCALARRRPIVGGAIAGLAGAFKLPGILTTIPAAAGRRSVWIGALAGAAVTATAMWPVLTHWQAGSNVHGGYFPQISLQGLVYAASATLGSSGATLVAIAVAICSAGALGSAGFGLLRGGDRQGWIVLALAAWLLVPNPYPWYGIWLIAVGALAPDSRAAKAAVWVAAAALLRYVPDAAGVPSAAFGVLASGVALFPYVLLLPVRRFAIINRPT